MKTDAELLRELTELTAASFREEAPAPVFTTNAAGFATRSPLPKPAPSKAPLSPQNLNWALESLQKLRDSTANRGTPGPKVIRTRHD